MIPSKVPGSSNPNPAWQDKGFLGMPAVSTTHPKVDYAMGLPGQATSPLENQVIETMDVQMLDIGPGVSGTINPGVDYT